MKEKRRGRLALVLCLSMLLTGTALGADMEPMDTPMGAGDMEPPGSMEMPGGMEMPDAMGGGGDAAPSQGAIVITDGVRDTEAEYEPQGTLGNITQQGDTLVISGLELTSGDYGYNALVVTGPDSKVRLEKANIRLGVDSPVEDGDTGGSATSIDNGATLYLSDCHIIVDGAARYVAANYNDATLVVNDSTLESTGSNAQTAQVSEPFSNEALLISGTARANFSVGATKTYYFNSTCMAEGWAALSTDSATGDGLDLYAYNTDGIAENGGYGTYADTNCRVWLYGSRLSGAELGCIISKNGQIHVYGSQAAGADLLAYNEGETVTVESSIQGGRNAVMIHAPDMMGQGLQAADCGTFTAQDATLSTTQALVSTKDYNDYGEATGAYVDYISGAVLLVRSTSANIDLQNVEMDSYSGTLIQSVLSADSMGNFLAPGDGDLVEPIAVTMMDMDVVGDIRHEDYQRRMTVDLEHTTLSGNIVSGTMEEWNRTWSDYGEVNWVVDDSYDTVYGVALTVGENATWNVTGESSLTSLTVAQGGTVNGEITLDGQRLIPEPGVTYMGDILVTGSYVPEPQESTLEAQPSFLESAQETPEVSEAPEEPSAAVTTQTQSQLETPAETANAASPAPVLVVVVLVVVALVRLVVVRKRKTDK